MMKSGAVIISVVMLFGLYGHSGARRAGAAEPPAGRGASYSNSKVYAGSYETNRLYKKNSGAASWKGSRKPASLEGVTCPEARSSLLRNGRWQGRFRWDGSCKASVEKADWAVGNYLNYEALPNE